MRKESNSDKSSGTSFDGILKGFTDLVEKLGDLAEKGESLKQSGEFKLPGKDAKGVYGFSVKVGGLGGNDVKVEPFGNIHKDKETGKSVVQEIREPLVDVFEEDAYTLLNAEMPGISAADVKLDVRDDILTIKAEKGDKKYSKEILLSFSPSQDKITVSCNNGIVEIKCVK
jgi:HSP20 family protein